MSKPIPTLDSSEPGSVLQWAMKNPTALRDAINLLNRLSSLQIVVIQDGVTNTFPLQLSPLGDNAIIQIEL